jgi:hypothetical protein
MLRWALDLQVAKQLSCIDEFPVLADLVVFTKVEYIAPQSARQQLRRSIRL